MKSSHIIIGAYLAVILAGCGGKAKEEKSDAGQPVPVNVITLKKQTMRIPVTAAGQFTTDDETILSFKTGGIVRSVFVREGDRIQKGQLLAALDLTEIEAGLSQAKTACEKARRDFSRVSSLYKDSVATLAQMQDAETGLKIAEQQLAAAQFNRNFSEIRAAGDGYILREFVNEGSMTGPGMPVFQTNGGTSGPWYLRVGMSDYEWSIVNPGDAATVALDAAPGKSFQARVFRKSKGADPYSGTFSVDLQMQNAPAGLLATGLFGKAEITPSAAADVWLVPYEALLDADGNAGYVFVTDDGVNVRKVRVTVSGLSGDNAIISGGLDGCAYLITGGSAYLNEQSVISVNRKSTER